MIKEVKMKKNTVFKLLIIILIAILFRMYQLDKPEGLWNDEYIAWFIASKQSITDFIQQMLSNCHMPLYYIYLKIWMILFGDSDFVLRMSSVTPSILSVPIMFFIGKEIKDNNTGLLAAFLTTISSFHIYFAQEMRLYSLVFFLSSFIVLYFFKFTKNQNKNNLFIFLLLNFILSATHTLGILFSFFNVIGIFAYLYKTNEEYKNKIKNIFKFIKQIMPFFIGIICLVPLIINIISTPSLSQFWSEFNILKVLFTFTDYFSPIQINILSPPLSIVDMIFYNNKVNWHFLFFAILPTIIAIYLITYSTLKKNRIQNYALCSSILFLLTIIICAVVGKMILLTKYTIEVYPILITALSVGIMSIERKKLKYTLAILFVFINLSYMVFSNNSVHKKTRPEGHKAPIHLIENSKLQTNDQILITFFDIDKFEKYIDTSKKYKFSSIHKYNFHKVMFENFEDFTYFEIIKNGKSYYRDYFKEYPNKYLTNYIYDKYIKNMKSGDRIGVVYLKNISVHSEKSLQNIITNEDSYEKSHLIYIAFSFLVNNLLYTFDNNLELESLKRYGDWFLVVYKKK